MLLVLPDSPERPDSQTAAGSGTRRLVDYRRIHQRDRHFLFGGGLHGTDPICR